MANINFFARLGNLLKGALSLFVSDLETKNPEVAYENSINSMVEKYTLLKKTTAAIISRRDKLSQQLSAQNRELEQAKSDLAAALATSQDDLALVAIEKKNQVEAMIKDLQAEVDQAVHDAEEAKGSLLSVKAEIGKLKAEKDRNLAKLGSAQARIAINAQLEGLSVDAEVQALAKVREHIDTTVAEANLGQELHNSDLDVRLKKLRQQSGSLTAQAELAQLKAQRSGQPQTARQM